MIPTLLALTPAWLVKAFAGIIALFAAVLFIRRDAKKDASTEGKLLSATEALKQERERIARDEALNGAADLAAVARRSGVLRSAEADKP